MRVRRDGRALINYSDHYRSVTHTARGRDGRQEGRECGYYHLHRYLNQSCLLHTPWFFNIERH